MSMDGEDRGSAGLGKREKGKSLICLTSPFLLINLLLVSIIANVQYISCSFIGNSGLVVAVLLYIKRVH